MDEGNGKSGDLEQWMKELLPDAAADNGMGGDRVTMPSSSLNDYNRQIRTTSLGENCQVAAITSNNNLSTWQHSQHILDNPDNLFGQGMTSNLPSLFEDFSQIQTPSNMVSKLGQQQQMQNQVLGQVSERPNIYHFQPQSNTYPSNLRQHQQASIGAYSTFHVMEHQETSNVLQRTGQTALQRSSLETHTGFVPQSTAPKFQMPAFHQSQNVRSVNQLKQGNPSRTVLRGQSQALLESTPEVELMNSFDWVDQAFQKLLLIKEKYLSEVIMFLNRAREERHRTTDAETAVMSERKQSLAEKILKFLAMSGSDISNWRQERLCQMMNDVLKALVQIRAANSHVKLNQQVQASGTHLEAPQVQSQQRENHRQFNCTPASFNQSLRQGRALSLPEGSVNLTKVGFSGGEHKVDASSVVNYNQHSPMRPAQQWAPHGSVVPSPPQKGSQISFDQRSLRMLLHPSDGFAQHNNLGTPQQMVTSSRNIFNSLDYSVSPKAQPPLSVSPQNKQQDTAMRRQKKKQPVQHLLTEQNKQQMLQKRKEDTNLRRFAGFNQNWSPLPPSSLSPYASSPQNSQQSSSPLERKDLSSKLSKSATPSLSSSPSGLPSPLAPLTPSSIPADYAKSPLSLEESSKLTKPSAAASQLPSQDTNQNQFVTDTQGSSKFCLHSKSTSPGDKSLSCDKGDSVKCLVKVVKSMSSRALNASLRDIDAVTNLTDCMAGNLYAEPAKAISHDLADDVSNYDHGNFILNSTAKSRMKRQLDTVTLNDSTSETGSCASGRTKRLKKEPHDLLLKEIKEVNQKLIEVVVDAVNVKDVSSTESDEGTLIHCSYIPMGLSGNNKMPNTLKQMFPNLMLEMMVTADYPNSSPTVLETLPVGCRDAEEGKYLGMKAKAKFTLSLRKYSQPISVTQMAEAWDICAREVLHEFAGQTGGGSFTSTYGEWENCVLAA